MNISKFMTALETRLNEYKNRVGLTYFKSFKVIATETPKYFKVFRTEIQNDETDTVPRNGSIVCFIDKATGDILKPASYKVPAKHARGNIGSVDDGMEAIDGGGHVKYLR
jgi:hypothetical protein